MIPTREKGVFPAKLLLFGEHVLLLGAPALAVPVSAFGGEWAWGTEKDRHYERMLQFAQSEALQASGIDTNQWEHDLQSGLFFNSTIPTGYGLGSSGALCAALYERYAIKKTEDLAQLKSIFAGMESFFHGNSSGIDPLTSYLNRPILIEHKTAVSLASPKPWAREQPLVFLLDTQLPRRTGPLVRWFLDNSEVSPFAARLANEYLPAHTATLQAWLSADVDLFWHNLRQVSVFQLEYFEPMVPHTVRNFWEKSIDSQDFTLKICGAGGGGFVLGFAKNAKVVRTLAERFRIVFPFD